MIKINISREWLGFSKSTTATVNQKKYKRLFFTFLIITLITKIK